MASHSRRTMLTFTQPPFLSRSLGYQYAGLLIALLAVVLSFMAPVCELRAERDLVDCERAQR